MRASRLIVFGLVATAGGALLERPAAADVVIADETGLLPAAVCLDVPLVPDLHLGIGLGAPEPCPLDPSDVAAPLPVAVCLDVPLVSDLQVGLGLGVPEPCPRALDEGVPPPAPVPDPEPAPVPAPAAVPAAAVPNPVARPVAAPPAVSPAPVAAPPVVAPPELVPSREIGSDRPTAPDLPPNPFGSTVGLVVVAAAVAGGTNILFRSS